MQNTIDFGGLGPPSRREMQKIIIKHVSIYETSTEKNIYMVEFYKFDPKWRRVYRKQSILGVSALLKGAKCKKL